MLREAEAALRAIDPADQERREVAELWLALFHARGSWRKLEELANKWVLREPEEVSWWVNLAYAARRTSSVHRAHSILEQALMWHAGEAIVHYNLACYAAQLGWLEEARMRLGVAVDLDESFRELARTDPDLAPLRREHPGKEAGPGDTC